MPKPSYKKSIDIPEVERRKIASSITEYAKNLAPDPGKNYVGECQLFRTVNESPSDPWPLVCRGQCEKRGCECRIVQIETETGRWSDLYRVIVKCECLQKGKPGKIVVE